MKTKNFLGLTFLSLTIILCLMPKLSSAQQNTVKFNLLPLIGKTFSFEYERMVAPKQILFLTKNSFTEYSSDASNNDRENLEYIFIGLMSK